MSLQIEAGKFYRRRDGEIVGPARRQANAEFESDYPWRVDGPGNGHFVYTAEGQYNRYSAGDHFDLVEAVPDPNAKIELNVANAFTRTKVRITADLGTATGIAARASELVGGDRDRQHGAKVDNFQRIATVWDAWLKVRKDPAAPLGPHDVAIMMSFLKAARTQSGAFNSDDAIDHCGYAACAGEIQAALAAEAKD